MNQTPTLAYLIIYLMDIYGLFLFCKIRVNSGNPWALFLGFGCRPRLGKIALSIHNSAIFRI